MSRAIFCIAALLNASLLGSVCAEDEITSGVLAISNDGTNYQWPELNSLEEKTDSGLCLSGGGSRSYVMSVGFLRGLHQLGALSKIKYLSAVSGGAWAASSYSYRQNHQVSDDEYLGSRTPLGDLTLSTLASYNPNSMLAPIIELSSQVASDPFMFMGFAGQTPSIGAIAQYLSGPHAGSESVWSSNNHKLLFNRLGIEKGSYFSYSEDMVTNIKQRNPALANATFIVPRPNTPYLVIGASVQGPADMAPLQTSSVASAMSAIEFTPLYSGTPYTKEYTFTKSDSSTQSLTLGGFIESYAFGAASPAQLLASASSNGVLDITPPAKPFSIEEAVGISSLAFSVAFTTNSALFKSIPVPWWDMVPRHNMFPTSGSAQDRTLLLGDGGNFENTGLLWLLRRKVRHIVVVDNSGSDLSSNTNLASLFGVLPSAFTRTDAFDYSRNTVFTAADYNNIYTLLSQKIALGQPAVVAVELVTVANSWWGIEANVPVKLTWSYLYAPSSFLSALPAETQAEVANNQFANSTFYRFPKYSTVDQAQLSASQSNLLAELGDFYVRESADLILAGLAISPSPSPSVAASVAPSPAASPEPSVAPENPCEDDDSALTCEMIGAANLCNTRVEGTDNSFHHLCPFTCGCCSVGGECTCNNNVGVKRVALQYGAWWIRTCHDALQYVSCQDAYFGERLRRLCPCECGGV